MHSGSAQFPVTDSPKANSDIIAAVDLGSNSFHMVVARKAREGLIIVDRLRETVRLGGNMEQDGMLQAPAMEAALRCLSQFGQRLRDVPPENVRAVGTNTLRRARNRGEFLDQAERSLGHGIQVISGIEEARLVYLGAVRTLPRSDDRRLVVDIGGGSTEMIVGEGLQTEALESLQMGCVSYSDRYFPGGLTGEQAFHEAELAASLQLRPVKNPLRRMGWANVIGTSGTIRAVRDLVYEIREDPLITLAGLDELRLRLVDAGNVGAAGFKSLSEERAPVFAGGLAILRQVFMALKIEQMQVAEGALREGLLYDLLGRLSEEDARELSVRKMQARYHVDADQAQRVTETALSLLARVKGPWDLESTLARLELGWAARLHEIGLDIAHAKYQLHGAYLLANADMPGFPREEQRLLSCLVGNHRRKLENISIETLPQSWRVKTRRLIVLLRLSVLLHRTRAPDLLPPMEVTAAGDKLTLQFPDGWLAQHPLTAADLAQEQNLLRAGGICLEFD